MKNVLRIALGFCLLALIPAGGLAQTVCKDALLAAENNYDIGRFADCLSGLEPCVTKGGFTGTDKVKAYRLVAKCYLAVDSVRDAEKYIRLILADNFDFQPEEHEPQRFKLEVSFVKTQLRSSMTSSVSKKMENIEYAPATMQVITAKDILDRGYQDIESIFRDLPGFDITTSFGISYSVLYTRGYRCPSFTERTMVMIDGVEDNDIWSNAALIGKQYPISSVKRVEVIYGPASTIYGANAFCGVINIVTKDEEDIFPATSAADSRKDKKFNVAFLAHTGYASYNTRYADVTASVKSKNVFLSVTARVNKSDGVDLSSYPGWNGQTDFSTSEYLKVLTYKNSKDSNAAISDSIVNLYKKGDPTGKYFTISGDKTRIIPTAAGIARADSLDRALFSSDTTHKYYKNVNKFKDPLQDYYIAAKLSVGNFKFGCQYWNKNDGSTGDYYQRAFSINSDYNSFEIRNYYMYARYDQNINERLSLSSFTYYRYQDYGNNFRTTSYKEYGNGTLTGLDMLNKKVPSIATKSYFAASNQVNTELKLNYHIDDRFDVLGGAAFRTGISQGDYITAGSYLTYAQVLGTVNPIAGGNEITEYTTSGYLTGSYHNDDLHLNVDIGCRYDLNKFSQLKGYGTQYNPRVAVIYHPGKSLIFKAIYAEAFLDASNLNKFSTSGTRAYSNPTLEPEKVKNIEVSARYKLSKRNYVEVAAYRSYYTNTLGLASVPYGSATTSQFQDIGKSLVYGVQAASEVFLGDNVSIYANLTYTDPRSIYPYRDYTKSGDSITVRTGDIAAVSANAGLNVTFFKKKLDVNLRVNIVGDKQTGPGTSMAANLGGNIAGYQVLNGAIGYKVYKDVLMLQAGCYNILNTQYYSPGPRNADGVQFPYNVPQPLRNYFVKLVVNFKK